MSSASWRKAILLNRSALLSAWPRHFPTHDFHTLRLTRADSEHIPNSHWDGESWKRAAREYHRERRQLERRR
jgi:hypothetical protein